jgi:hypothetical protein
MIDGPAEATAGATAKKMAAKVSNNMGLWGPRGFRDRRVPHFAADGIITAMMAAVDQSPKHVDRGPSSSTAKAQNGIYRFEPTLLARLPRFPARKCNCLR